MASCIDCGSVLESCVNREGQVILRCRPCHSRIYGPVLTEPKKSLLGEPWFLFLGGLCVGTFMTAIACYLFGG